MFKISKWGKILAIVVGGALLSSCSLFVKRSAWQAEENQVRHEYDDHLLKMLNNMREYGQSAPPLSADTAFSFCKGALDQRALETCYYHVYGMMKDPKVCEKVNKESPVRGFHCYDIVLRSPPLFSQTLQLPQWCTDLNCRSAYYMFFWNKRASQPDRAELEENARRKMEQAPFSLPSSYTDTEIKKLKDNRTMIPFTESLDFNIRGDGSTGFGYAFLPFRAERKSGYGFSTGLYDLETKTPFFDVTARGVEVFSTSLGLGAHFPKNEKTHYHVYFGWGLLGANILLGYKNDMTNGGQATLGFQYFFMVPWR